MKKKAHKTNKALSDILRTLYSKARVTGAMQDGGVPAGKVQPKCWKNEQKEAADEFSTAILKRVIYPVLKPYEQAVMRYGHHEPECDTWRGLEKECSCGLEAIRQAIKANLVLQQT